MLLCDFGVDNKFLGVIVQRFSRVLAFNAVKPLYVDKFTDLRDELNGPF